MRWFLRMVATFVGLCGLAVATGWFLFYGPKDPARERLKEGYEVSANLDSELGRRGEVTVEPLDGDHVLVKVKFSAPPIDPKERKALIRSANIIARRWVHHVRDV